MFDLLRFARVGRTVIGLVGGWRNPVFRAFALVLTCVGVGVAVSGGSVAFGVGIAVALWVGVTIFRGGIFPGGAHRY